MKSEFISSLLRTLQMTTNDNFVAALHVASVSNFDLNSTTSVFPNSRF